jgi:hypothetical protein
MSRSVVLTIKECGMQFQVEINEHESQYKAILAVAQDSFTLINACLINKPQRTKKSYISLGIYYQSE